MALYGTRLQTVYTSQEEIERIYSEDGVYQQLADLIDNEFLIELIERATSKVNQYLGGLYTYENLASSVWIREKATYIACHFLSIRRGNPTLFQYQYEEALADLQDARDNLVFLDIAQSSGVRPLGFNVLHDNRFTITPIRIIPATSSKLVSGQLAAFTTPYWWW